MGKTEVTQIQLLVHLLSQEFSVTLYFQPRPNPSSWIANSRPSDHMTKALNNFISYEQHSGNTKVKVANRSILSVNGKEMSIYLRNYTCFLPCMPKMSYTIIYQLDEEPAIFL